MTPFFYQFFYVYSKVENDEKLRILLAHKAEYHSFKIVYFATAISSGYILLR